VLRAIDSTRRIVRDLRPQLLDELGLSAALESMGANFESRTGVRTEVEILGADHADAELGALAATALYRIAQESLNNVLKHAHARFVHLMLDATSPHQVELSVTDDGVGIAGEHRIKPSSYGLQGMAERVRALGGRLVIVPQPEGGTMVQAIVPKTGCELEQASAAPAR
jgi:signal transduction histidine kinase